MGAAHDIICRDEGQRSADDHKKKEKTEEFPIYGDLLNSVFSHVPLIDLVSASYVSNSWKESVISASISLSESDKQPWLFIYTQNRRTFITTKINAYEPRSDIWMEMNPSPIQSPINKCLTAPLHSVPTTSNSKSTNLLCKLTSSKLSYSFDPFHLNWQHAIGPSVWRVDPIIAAVGSRVIVAGGVVELLYDDPLVVEMYDTELHEWCICESMPVTLKHSASASCLYVTVNEDVMFVTEKDTGVTYSFNPMTNSWNGPYDLCPDTRVISYAIGCYGDAQGRQLILAGLIGHDQEHIQSLRLWKVNSIGDQILTGSCDLIGDMPLGLLEKMKGVNSMLGSISIIEANGLIYMYNSSEPRELISCRLFDNGICKWNSISNLACDAGVNLKNNVIFSTGVVKISHLQHAMRVEGQKFKVKLNVNV